MKARQILPTKLERCATKAVTFKQEAMNLSKAVNSPYLSEDPNTGLRKERTAAAELLRVTLAYVAVIAWVILN